MIHVKSDIKKVINLIVNDQNVDRLLILPIFYCTELILDIKKIQDMEHSNKISCGDGGTFYHYFKSVFGCNSTYLF